MKNICKDLVFFNGSILMAKALACCYSLTRNPQNLECTQKTLNLRRIFQTPLNGCSNPAKWGGVIQAPDFLKSWTISNKILLLPFPRMSKCQCHYLPLVLCFQTDLQDKSCFLRTLNVNCPTYIQRLITTIHNSTLLQVWVCGSVYA